MDFQEPFSLIMVGITDLHDNVMYYLFFITIFVAIILLYIIFIKRGAKGLKFLNHGTFLEIIWVTIPIIILLLIAIPSFKLLYTLDEVLKPTITLKIIGNQWFWTYELNDGEDMNINFDSYTLNDNDTFLNEYLRLLQTDNVVFLPILTNIRLIVTSEDVIHSFSVPSYGVKIDAIPGRLNQVPLYILKEGTVYGQCSEICGTNHYNMSIEIKGSNYKEYVKWILNKLN